MLEIKDMRTPVPTHYGDWVSKFGETWKKQTELLKEKFGSAIEEVKMPGEFCVDVPVLYVRKADFVTVVNFLKSDSSCGYNFLADYTATDELAEGKPFRFEMVLNLYSTARANRIRIKVRLSENEEMPTLVPTWAGANWAEREIFDMFGIKFTDHPDLRRVLMDHRYVGHPLRKDFPVNGNRQLFVDPELADAGLLEDEALEKPAVALTDPDDLWDNARTIVNIGPTHPSMHGAFRTVARLNGETIEKAYCEFGYTHRAKEKMGENRTYHQWIVYTDRLNYVSSVINNTAYALAVEKMMGVSIPDRTVWLRMICTEMGRIIDHLVCFGINAVDIGAFSFFLYGYHQREEAYTLIEKLCGARLTASYVRIGGLMYDAPEGWEKEVKAWVKETREVINEMDRLLTNNKIWHMRTVGVATFDKEMCMKYSYSGPNARAAGIDVDLRRDQPCLYYKDVEFDVPLGKNGDIFDRYVVRLEECRQSLNIIAQCCDRVKPGPIWTEDKRVRIPDKDSVYNTMEGLIYHFKFFMTGFDVPAGESYSSFEAANGELGFHIVSKGGPKAHRMRIRGPSFWHLQGLEKMVIGGKIADMVGALGSINVIAGEIDR